MMVMYLVLLGCAAACKKHVCSAFDASYSLREHIYTYMLQRDTPLDPPIAQLARALETEILHPLARWKNCTLQEP